MKGNAECRTANAERKLARLKAELEVVTTELIQTQILIGVLDTAPRDLRTIPEPTYPKMLAKVVVRGASTTVGALRMMKRMGYVQRDWTKGKPLDQADG